MELILFYNIFHFTVNNVQFSKIERQSFEDT